ncbi:hypothetical protein EYZ11_003425 [Aspergillus tanneri]|uniref:Intradiol ring-cleavage dioxygenases domain-containing protein n=1 Tax=Aspergillus tanneri TaxID=1220188 RepID=A0A4S3JQH3_9EURO|nr:uncharacterized protein ATNIH1004_010146 [Aspergillus tanneri]KAA8643377.1 hypothetical protein ATNIH1004_010146 [Aspergillus tanneri]THC97107.1 hypothetical protein EYZ11_003425 [Aspergillus tanneri]
MVRFGPTFVAGLAGLASIAAAHPGHDVKAEAAERAAFLKRAPLHSRGLSHCTEKLHARGHEASNVARRELTVEKLRHRRGLRPRALYPRARDFDATIPIPTSHHSSLDVDQTVDPAVLFGSNATCILGPDTTEGPYYVSGELIRKDVSEEQAGVPLYLDFQIIDTSTCDPLPNIYLDIWHCNATGVYSGVLARGNGDSNDVSLLDATFLRGIQKTDKTGVVQFESIFPGHYTGRTHHIHVLSHPGNSTTVNPNGTISGLFNPHASYVGQTFFDQDLIYKVEALDTYAANKQPLTTNDEDGILAGEAKVIDPFMQYVYLGDRIEDGLFAWISLGIDASRESNVRAGAYYTENGGVEDNLPGGGPPPA